MSARVRPLLALAVLLACALPGGARAAGERIALVVGNADYERVARLVNPLPDARAVGAELEAMGFDAVAVVEDGTRLELEAALDDFGTRAESAATALFYFAGHGIQIDGENYLVPVDVDLSHRRDVRRLLGLDEIMDEVSQASGLGLVVLDACRDNPFGERLAEKLGRGAARAGLGSVAARVRGNTLVAYATEADAVALDGDDGHSPYTRALVRHLGTPGLDVRWMLGAVRDDVVAATGGEQVPHVYGSLGGSLVTLAPVAGDDPAADAGPVAPPAPEPRASLATPSEPAAPPTPVPPPGHGFLTVDATPADATVRITNIAPAYERGMALPLDRDYAIMVSRAGYRAQRFDVRLAEADARFEVTLEPLDGGAATAGRTAAAVQPLSGRGNVVTVEGVGPVAGDGGEAALAAARRAAVDDAIERAVLRVAGAIVRGAKSLPARSAAGADGGLEARLRRDAAFRDDIASRPDAFARVDRIESEGADGGVYRVRAVVRVETAELGDELGSAGLRAAPAARPAVHVTARRRVDGEDRGPDPRTAARLREALSAAGVPVAAADGAGAAFRVPVTLSFSTGHSAEYGLWSADCAARYEILDARTGAGVAAHRLGAGPEGGVSSAEVVGACAAALVPGLARRLAERVPAATAGAAEAGDTYRLSIADVPGSRVAAVTEAVRGVFHVRSVDGTRFEAGTLGMDVRYAGAPLDLVRDLTRSLDAAGARAELVAMHDDGIDLALR